MKKIIILGGGISGLSLAWFFKLRYGNKLQITLLEKSDRVGGWIRTLDHEGFLFELGPHSCRPHGTGKATLHLINSLGLQDQIITPDPNAASQRFLWLNSRLQPVPNTFASMLFSPMLGWILPALWREWRIPRNREEDESIHSFFTRRFGANIANCLIDPLVTGIYAGDPRKLSVRSCFPYWHTWEQRYGSVLRGWLKNRKSSKSANSLSKVPFFSLKNGMESLTCELGHRLEDNIQKRCGAKYIHLMKDAIAVETDDGHLDADHVFSTLPATALSSLLTPLQSNLNELESSSVAVVSLGYKRKVLKHSGFGYLIPSQEKQDILGMIWDSCVFPQQNRNDEETRLTVMLGGIQESGELIAKALSACSKHLGIESLPDAYHVHHAQEAIPQYHVGHAQRVKEMERLVAGLSARLTCLGSAFYGVSVNDSIARSLNVVETS